MKLYWFSQDEILNQVKQEKNFSKDYFEQKRDIFRDRIRLINWQDKWKDKVNINTAASIINTLIALNYQDELTVKFYPRWIEDYDITDTLESLAKFDFDEMWSDTKNYQKEFDRLFYWLSVRTFCAFNWDRNTPEYNVEDPLSWYADPNPKWFNAMDFRWHWFEKEVTKQILKNEWSYKNIDNISFDVSEDKYLDITKKNEASRLNTQRDDTINKQFTIYYHYTIINWEYYFVVCDFNCSALLKFEKLDIKRFPIILNYFRPRSNDPFGDSVMDYVEDKQRADSKLFNLQLIKATQEALWWDFLYNTNKIKNRNDLEKPSITKRFIWVNLNPWESIWEVIQQVPRDRLNTDVEAMRWAIKREAQQSIWVDNVIQWVRWDKSITARESQTIQQNANLNLALNNKVNSWGEKDFWNVWYLYYQEYFTSYDEKVIRVNNGIMTSVLILKKTDFTTSKDLDVAIINKSDKKAEEEQDRLNIPNYQMLLQSPELSQFEKLLLNRHIMRISWTPLNLIKSVFSETYEEEQAKSDLVLLNQNEDIWYIDPTEDQKTYLIIYKNWLPTKAMNVAKAERERIYKEQLKMKRKLMQQQGWEQQWNIWWALNQSMSNSLSQQREWTNASSLQDIQ